MSAGAAGGQVDSAKGWPVRMLGLGPGVGREKKEDIRKADDAFQEHQLLSRSVVMGWIKQEMKGKPG